MRIFFLACALLLSSFLLSQNTTTASQSPTKMAFLRPGGPSISDLANYGATNNVEGTPYLHKDWHAGRVRFEGQPNFSEELEVLLDLDKHELYVKLSTGFIGEFPMDRLDAVEIHSAAGDTTMYEIHNLQELFGAGDYGRRFFRVLHRGEKYLTLHQPGKYLRREADIENLGMVRRPDKYLERNRYWVFDGVQMREIKRNQRQIQKAFPNKSAVIKRLVRTENLDLQNNDDIGRLFALLEE